MVVLGALGTYNPNPSGWAYCAQCRAGTYINVTAATVCSICPPVTISAVGSDSIEDCICDVGLEGPGGEPCTECNPGFFKPTNGTGFCTACEAGTYLNLTGGSACVGCPTGATSRVGSVALADCICDVGFTGDNGTACSA
eukprot:2634723-Rhodomonas_salina.1